MSNTMEGEPLRLRPAAYRPFPAGELSPGGWLKRQLELQARGLAGHLDEIWPDVRDSKWIGGDREGWERVPYWLDGFIPLAYLLKDPALIRRAGRYVDAILSAQRGDGWICPCPDGERGGYDVWAVFLIAKVLTVYFQCSGDERVEPAVYGILKNLRSHLNAHTLFGWGAARWYECLIPLYWLYERRPEGWMPELAHLLRIQGMDYDALYQTLPMDPPVERPHWSFHTHVVNTAMALKAGGLYARLAGGDPERSVRRMLEVLEEKHGTVIGHFTGDECLAGKDPIQGTELCGVVEAMYSYEQLLALTGNGEWGDRLELLAFNGLPAAVSPDMWTHQYDQLTNQPECSRIPEEAVPFTSNSGESHLFGLEPNFGCCTANFGQGWPKLALSAFLKGEDEIAVALLVPGTLSTQVRGVGVEVEVRTDYPFRDTARIEVRAERPVEFPLFIRIPGFASGARINGKPAEPGKFVRMVREWNRDVLEVELEFAIQWKDRPNRLAAVQRGPLVFALPVREEWIRREYERDGVERKFPYCDYELKPREKWNYGFCGREAQVKLRPMTDCPFSPEGAPVELILPMAEIPWESAHGICAPEPASRKPLGEPEEKRLIPYGCTNLRMTELPLLE